MNCSTEQLKSCPFCGNAPELDAEDVRSNSAAIWASIHCRKCFTRPMASASCEVGYWTVDQVPVWVTVRTAAQARDEAIARAIRHWNRREPARRESLELEAVITEIEAGKPFDEVCLATLRRVRNALR